MVRRKTIRIVVGIILPALVLLVLFYPTRERQVRKRFKILKEWVRVEGPEEAIVQAVKYRKPSRCSPTRWSSSHSPRGLGQDQCPGSPGTTPAAGGRASICWNCSCRTSA